MSGDNLHHLEEEESIKKYVQIRLITGSEETLHRTLQERVSLKLGRQVKSAQEKMNLLSSGQENPAAAAATGLDVNESGSDKPHSDDEKRIQLVSQRKEGAALEPVWFKSKVVSRSHAEIWLKDGQVYLRDVGSSSGTFLNDLRLSPPSKMSRPYPLREGDVIQLGVDYQGRSEDIYKAVEIKISLDVDPEHLKLLQQIPIRFKAALFLLLVASNPYSTQQEQDPKQDTSVDCCICISGIGPFQALFIAPCSHCFHYKCIQHVLKESVMFPCPVCRQVANLEASVSMESVCQEQAFNTASLRRSLSSIGLGEDMQIDQTFSLESSVRQQFEFELAQGARDELDIVSPHTVQTNRNSMEIPILLHQGKMNVDDEDDEQVPAADESQ